jgi:hypothetical protein
MKGSKQVVSFTEGWLELGKWLSRENPSNPKMAANF